MPSAQSPNVHTFFVSLGGLELKRSYEIFGERIAPVSKMLMAGINPATLRAVSRPLHSLNLSALGAPTSQPPELGLSYATRPQAQPVNGTLAPVPRSSAEAIEVQRINELVSTDKAWDPLSVNMYETRESAYKSMFDDSDQRYDNVSSQILIFPNDSLVLGKQNKHYLFDLAERVRHSEDIVRVVGCSHGNTQLSNGNEKLAKGRAIRVKEELMLAGVEESAVLHEACWANVHFDEG